MEFTKTDYKRCIVVKAAGRYDSATAGELEKVLTDLLPADKDIILDMADITFVSSAGWWSIIRVQKELKKKRADLMLVSLNDNVRDSMELIGILQYFTVYQNLVDALGNL
ncbi:MAG TPA: STAS domain-containing protein [Anaerolineaceae bacterium]|jgi:anti-anti-sigma factor|nr:STAS domain-containing protein [Anaerolineales bacterium]HOG58798.1 STAS domain-containing protein [Anaerolineaceae bacterium]HOR83344.1 STAS domain-containing protein [Anaerolineaceae bacterium]HOT52667.1 STAS domain-containing protein [Anaerolineaceae bacterium]HPL42952.1 STAS domain-containing protein [Anaerolineaceae bacterium]